MPDDASAGSWRVRLSEVGATGVTAVPELLADTAGGPIAVVGRNDSRPKQAMLAVYLVAERHMADGFVRPVSGTVVITASGESLAVRFARQIGRVWTREGSFN